MYLCVTEKGAEMQATLAEMTGQKTVPNVFIGGQHVGESVCSLMVMVVVVIMMIMMMVREQEKFL